ncbi:hypothetical protein [Dendronalium sp. ChiSLP03b]|uniref:hypothetical protein n=1 Tax=Dendronalium sp. ChiSLP03b TaxID=3075381 RepID=UPI002AD48688|nr:hypothetical protein [Dendronalium sp. ChiSLP03b]MDZ8208318.1 hypothetical protein [Dendronalium sp. ChiSLP03b]
MSDNRFSSFLVRLAENIIFSPDLPAECGVQHLREILCTPQFRLNAEIQRTIRRYWENVPGAIAYLKEALRTRIGVKSPEAVFVAACKEGRKPESAQAKSAVKDWFEWARRQRIVIAMSGEVVYTRLG